MGGQSAQATVAAHGWDVRNPIRHIADTDAYRRYIQESKAEFTVSKAGYAATRSGWFGDRSAAYLASGRPVVTLDTGWPGASGETGGLLTFRNVDEAVERIADVNSRYAFHCREARRIAEECFASHTVLASLLEQASAAERPLR